MKKKTPIGTDATIIGKSIGGSSGIGFAKLRTETLRRGQFILDHSSIHNVTIASTGSGKGRGAIIPNLISNPSSSVVLDPKGENCLVTWRARRLLGNRVICLDPFQLLSQYSDSFNPFDSYRINPKQDPMSFAQSLASLIGEKGSEKEVFWDHSGTYMLLAPLICYMITALPELEWNIGKLVSLLINEDVIYNLAVILDTAKTKMPSSAYNGISSFMHLPELTRGGVLFTAQNYLRAFNNPQILSSLASSSFDLNEFASGEKKFTIYVVIPPAYIQSHFPLIKLWMYTLFRALTERRQLTLDKVIFYLDEIAQFGNFDMLENVMTIGRGYGIRCWLFLQSLQQLQSNYPKSYRTMIENCGTMQVFGINSKLAGDELSNLTGVPVHDLTNLDRDEQFIVRGCKISKALKVDYLKDSIFAGRFSDNPFYSMVARDRKLDFNSSFDGLGVR